MNPLAVYRFFKLLLSRKVLIAVAVGFSIFMLAQVNTVIICIYKPIPAGSVLWVYSAPYYGGMLLMGFFGLIYAYKHAKSKASLFGFLIVVFAYVGIEVLFKACGGV